MKQFTRESPATNWDWSDGEAVGPIILMLAYYWFDSLFQGLAYYVLGLFTNDPWKLARLAGLYKAVQSAGVAAAFGMDATKYNFLREFLVSALLPLLSLPLVALVIWKLPESTAEIEGQVKVDDLDIEDSDTALPPGHHLHIKDDQLTSNTSRSEKGDGLDEKKEEVIMTEVVESKDYK